MNDRTRTQALPTMKELNTMLSPYQKSDDRYSMLQMASSLFLYIIFGF